ncbi:MAG: tetratricopeptide repeat protein [Saprospiraceae bacterium]
MAKSKKQLKKQGKAKDFRKKINFMKMEPRDWQFAGVCLLLTIVTFISTIGHDFVNWDDDYNLANNTNTALLSWNNIVNIFSQHVIGNYNPLPILTFTIERSIVGLNPALYHIDNLILHLICVFFVYRIFRLLNLTPLAAAAGALLFGIHPMRVESVTWVTERKDVLFGAFFLSALWFYVIYVKTGYVKKYFYAALGLFVFALFSKIQSVSLPLSMLVVDYYFKRPLKFKLFTEKWAFFLLALIIGLIGFYFLGKQGSINDKTNYNILERLMIGGYSTGVYLVKFIFPYRMSPLYPYPATLPIDVYIGPVVGLGLLGFIYVAYKKDWRPYLFGVLFFIVNIMFVLQIVGAGQGYLADRFTYIPYIGLIFMVIYAGQWLYAKNQAAAKPAFYGFGVVLVLFMFMTIKQNKIWHNSDTLWTHVLKYYTDTPLPYRNRANYRRDEGRIEDALKDYDSAIRLKPDGALYNSRAKLYFNLQKYEMAMSDYNLAIQNDSTQGEYYVNRGAVFALSNQFQLALNDFNKGLKLDPKHANGYKNRSLVYESFQQWDKAVNDITTYLNMHPEDADLWYERGRLKNILQQPADAIPDIDRAIQLNNKQGLYYYEKMKSYLSLNQKANALQQYTFVKQFGIKVEPAVLTALSN